MAKQVITGIGGVIFRAKDPAALAIWYDDHLGITALSAPNYEPWHQEAGPTAFSPSAANTDYLPAHQQVMFNFRVTDLDLMLEQLGAGGVKIDEKRQDEDFGRFAWTTIPRATRSSSGSPSASAIIPF